MANRSARPHPGIVQSITAFCSEHFKTSKKLHFIELLCGPLKVKQSHRHFEGQWGTTFNKSKTGIDLCGKGHSILVEYQ